MARGLYEKGRSFFFFHGLCFKKDMWNIVVGDKKYGHLRTIWCHAAAFEPGSMGVC